MAKTTVKQAVKKRVYFTEEDHVLDLPNLITHQLQSWKEFVQTGLGGNFRGN